VNAIDWPAVKAGYEAWWQGELIDRPLLQVTAPLAPRKPTDELPDKPEALQRWFTDPTVVVPRLQREATRVFYGGDAFPVAFPFVIGLPAIEAAYLGCPYHIVGSTGWAAAILTDWESRSPLQVDPHNAWWLATQRLLEAGASSSAGQYQVGLPDLEGGGEIIALLRGAQQLALDLVDHPQAVRQILAEETPIWQYYYRACFEIIHRCMPGYVDWLGIWSDRSYATVENDFSTMISPAMFRKLFLSSLEKQVAFLDRSIFHLDGPGGLPHLDTLLSIPDLDGIQWVIGPADGLMTDWIPLLHKIQGAGKKVVAACQPGEVRRLLAELQPERLLLTTSCPSVEDVHALLAEAYRYF
jgi:hypothetical protein